MIILSFSANMYFILAQLFNTLYQINTILEWVYVVSSFVLLVTRTVFLCIYSGDISTNSKEIVIILNKIPTRIYSLEIQRLYNFISFNEMALNGRNLFIVKKGLILKIIGAVVTYSLVLIQLHVQR